jgi:hypothetical protein
MQTNLAEKLSNWGTQQLLGRPVPPRPWARHHEWIASLTTAIVEEVVPSHQGSTIAKKTRYIKEESLV